MDSAQLKRIFYQNPGEQTQQRIKQALDKYEPNEAAWDRARVLLAGGKWEYRGNPDLDDTADTAYSIDLPAGQSDVVIAGLAYQQLLGVGFTIRALDKMPQGYRLTMSDCSATVLQKLVPSMQLPRNLISAGHSR